MTRFVVENWEAQVLPKVSLGLDVKLLSKQISLLGIIVIGEQDLRLERVDFLA